ncbi:aminotransferase class I/II-fold pyridoxal phosphate-dependent enzyme [Actinocrinis puniceicyclus]|uniref:Aminotransferase class I/II-fold pyridoxal phosphate-dependent enzyme n=1 Tax=Actinocrinis puniceicyclus TaxID=977794 RepID=A0A8J8BBD6_9ACTN|nr:aminotransferase class I/II-fold pyridoxal phosphate-dependent enzyme [Actinocrinis puniceicyclus]
MLEQTAWVAEYEVSGARASDIAASIEAAITHGRLSPGTALPPVRELAAQLGVNPNTAASAYRLLRDRGTVETRGRHGTQVRERPATSPASRSLKLPAGTVDLSTGNPDPALLPHLSPRPVTRPPVYGDPALDPALRRRAERVLSRDGIDAEHLACTFGTLDGIDRLLAARLRPGDTVAVEDPAWAQLLDLLAADRLTPYPVPVDDAGPDPQGLAAALAAGAKAFIVTTRAQNPYGAAVGADRARRLRAVLRDHPDVLTVEDDHGADVTTGPPNTLAEATRHWAYLRSASKAYGPDLRIALLSADPITHDLVAGRLRHTARHVSRIIQSTWSDALADHSTQRLVATAADLYAERRVAMISALRERGVQAHGSSGLNVWVPVPDESAALSALLAAGYAAAPGAWFRIRSGPGLRITTAALDPRRCGPVADALAGAVHRTPGADTGWS